ncbi:Uncharacterised protein [Chromobacterium violaceum]|uniref:Uncharacterized protein n=1 Tax=Chromobacterium violaceum TaxID=536 RepID=A0A447TJQ0_CHRVL|nr:Uncharacterised protein [Chromobacterium violaceum]
MALHRVDVEVLDVAAFALLGVAHDVVGDQHHRVPRPDAAHHAFGAGFLVVEVVGEVPLFRQVFAQQPAGVDVQRFRAFGVLAGDVGQDADAAGEDGFEHEAVVVALVGLAFVAGLEGLAHVGVLLGQAEFGRHAGAGAAAGAENVEIQPRLVGLDAAGVHQVGVDQRPVGVGEAQRVLVENDLGQVLAQNGRVAGAAAWTSARSMIFSLL